MKRIFRFASLLMSAVMLLSCSGNLDDGDNTGSGSTGGDDSGSGTTGGGSTTPKTLTLSSDKNLIQTFDGDYATLTVMLDGEKITDPKAMLARAQLENEPVLKKGKKNFYKIILK